MTTAYDPRSIAAYFDTFAEREWTRLTRSPADEISLAIHTDYLERHVASGARVLEIGAGPGRFTEVLARLDARVVVADISGVQLGLNERMAAERGFAHAVVDRREVDICDLSMFESGTFDTVVAYGGPFSYVLDRRDVALAECLRVLRPGGMLLLSVMSLWGSAHARLPGVLDTPISDNLKVTRSGDITPETLPGRPGGYMHLFRVDELFQWLRGSGLEIAAMSASGCLCIAWDAALATIRADPEKWAELLRMELEASADPACLGMGTHLIVVARKP